LEALSGRFPDCEKGKCKRKLSDYLMRGGLYIEIGFEYKKIFRQMKKRSRLGSVKILKTLSAVTKNQSCKITWIFLDDFLVASFRKKK